MGSAFKSLVFLMGLFMLIGLRNISLAQAFISIFTGGLNAIDGTYSQLNDYARENEKRGIGKIQPFNGKPYNSNDF